MNGAEKIHGRKPSVPFAVKTEGYEFFGPPGVFILTVVLPILVYAFNVFCNDISGCPAPSLLHPKSLTWEKLKEETGCPNFASLFDLQVTAWVLAYYLLCIALQMFLPGEIAEGTELRCGGRLKYKFNTLLSTLAILGACAVGTAYYGAEFPVWTFIDTNYVQIITANLLISFVLANYVYLVSFSVPHPHDPNPEKRLVALGAQTGNMLYDWFMGRELNPRIILPIPFLSEASRTIDIKIFMEMRPGLLGYILVNLSNIAKQYRTYGTVTWSILIPATFQAYYVFDSLVLESAILTTMDCINDGFGFMLSFGDLVWVPFIYSLQTHYLSVHPYKLSWLITVLILLSQGVGMYIFRSSNLQKNIFRTNPSDPRVSHLQFMPTRAGTRLLVSGWWGRARHINYLGDWIMSWSYTLPTGLAGYQIVRTATGDKEVVQGEARGWGTIFTYFYIVYFTILLLHRERRDDHKCKRKYGKDWDEYKRRVPSRIIPGIY